MKRKIEFNFSKWGKEGVTVEPSWPEKAYAVSVHVNPVNGQIYGVFNNGSLFVSNEDDLVMYEEVKPREIWVNEYPQPIGIFKSSIWNDERSAALNTNADCIRQVKFIEVIEEGDN